MGVDGTVFVEQLSAASSWSHCRRHGDFPEAADGFAPERGVEPWTFQEAAWVLPFDHTNGYTSGIALVNPSTSQDISGS